MVHAMSLILCYIFYSCLWPTFDIAPYISSLTNSSEITCGSLGHHKRNYSESGGRSKNTEHLRSVHITRTFMNFCCSINCYPTFLNNFILSWFWSEQYFVVFYCKVVVYLTRWKIVFEYRYFLILFSLKLARDWLEITASWVWADFIVRPSSRLSHSLPEF
jgi:hypothetical protein